ncbi:hypothetical protein BBJ28_00010014 [Nothophytophthora sp. Chile5]|nr:hypothetical protein BBJ28_00010014 [Nothophytophthora sp. Chile5]
MGMRSPTIRAAWVVGKYSAVEDNNFTQARVFYKKVLDDAVRDRLMDSIAISLVNANKTIQKRTLDNFNKVGPDCGKRLQDKMDVMLKAKAVAPEPKKSIVTPLNPPCKAFPPLYGKQMRDDNTLPPERLQRQAWLGEQLQERQKQRERERGKQLVALELENERLWSPFIRQATRTGELNIAWQNARGLFNWERVLPLRNLLALRITGHDQLELPEALPATFPALQTLSLVANGLERLPSSIGMFRHLTELDLTKNRLRELPDSLTELTGLTALNLSCNALERLPEDFGRLDKLEKLWLESNALTELPTSIGLCRSARCANFNGNLLTELPVTLGDLTALTTLSVNLNDLRELPEALTRLPNLRVLHASRNKIVKLPRNMGEMHALRELRLDWNIIRELPFSFRTLTDLRVLCMEQNPLRLPTGDVVARGVPETLRFMEKALADFQRSSRREIVEALQELLAFAAQLVETPEAKGGQQIVGDLPVQRNSNEGPEAKPNVSAVEADVRVIQSLFEPNCDRLAPAGIGDLKLYGVVWDCFYSELLPAIERQRPIAAESALIMPLLAASTPPFAQRFSPEEVEDALQNYDDEFSAASVAGGTGLTPNVSIEFRRCACLDPVALRERGQRVREVCMPRTAPYHCQRGGRLIRAQMLTTEEAQDQLASTYLRTKVARLTLKTRRRAVEYINSPSGVEHFERTARALARTMAQRHRRLRKLFAKHEKTLRRIETRRDKLQRKVEALRRTKAARLQTTQGKCVRLEKDRVVLQRECEAATAKDKDGALAAAKTKKLRRVDEKLAKLRAELEEAESELGGPEDAKISELELALEGLEMETQKLTTATDKAKELNEGLDEEEETEDEDEEAEEEASEGSDEDNNNSDDGNEDSEEEDSEEEEVADSEASKVSTGAASQPSGTPFFQIDMPDLQIVDYRKAAIQAVELVLEKRANGDGDGDGNTAAVVATKKTKVTKTVEVPEEELLELLQTQVRDAYVEMQCEKVTQQATREFLQMRAVLQRWRGLGTRAVFEAWHEVAHASCLDASAVRARIERKKLLAEQNRVLQEQFERMEARRWIQRSDMYTDEIYYEHESSGETRWEPPLYWLEEQEQKHKERQGSVPLLKLPPI